MKYTTRKIITIFFAALLLLFLIGLGCPPMPGDRTTDEGVLLFRNHIYVTEFPEYGLICFTYQGIDCHPLLVR